MKIRITKPRKLPNGQRAEYYGVRLSTESAFEAQALKELYPKMGSAPKGEKTEGATELRFRRIREAVEHRAYLLSIGRPVLDTVPIQQRAKEYLEFGRGEGGKRGFGWAEGHAEHVAKYIADWISALNLKTFSDIKQGPFDIEKARLMKTLAPNTVNRRVFTLQGFCTWGLARGYLQAMPFHSRALDKTPKTPRGAFTLDELRLLFTEPSERWCLLYRTAYYCRLRRNELASLKVGSVLWAEGLIDLAARDAKDKRRAFVPVPQGLLADLWAYSLGKADSAPLLDFPKKKAAFRLHQHMEKLGIPLLYDGKRRDFHSLGASTATSMSRHGVAPALAQKAMRHASWVQTENYIKLEASEVRAVLQGLEDEIGHTGDTQVNLDEETTMQTVGSKGLIAKRARSLSPSARRSKLTPFPRKKQNPKAVPDLTWDEFQDFATQIRHMVSAGEADTLKSFFALSLEARKTLLKGAKVGAA